MISIVAGACEPLVPDETLRDAYLEVGRRSGKWRERLIADTALIEAVRTILGPEYGHVSLDWLRNRIVQCAKNPANHGGGWGRPDRPAKGRRAKPHRPHGEVPGGREWYDGYLASPRWAAQRARCFDRDGNRCRICNDRQDLEPHHRSYQHCGYDTVPDKELADLTTLCRVCHHHAHVCCDRLKTPAR
jgi:hypothetical protein